jgi:hypothetical protein
MVVGKLICSYGGRKVENPYVLLASIKLNRLVQFFFKKINYIGTIKGFVCFVNCLRGNKFGVFMNDLDEDISHEV